LILLRDYPSINYHDIKEIVFNSINYSFLNKSEKEKITKDLEARFVEFEVGFGAVMLSSVSKQFFQD